VISTDERGPRPRDSSPSIAQASTSKRRKYKPTPVAPRPETVVEACVSIPPPAAEEVEKTGAQPDGRTLLDGIDLAQIVDLDLEPAPGPWQEVEPRRRKRADAAA